MQMINHLEDSTDIHLRSYFHEYLIFDLSDSSYCLFQSLKHDISDTYSYSASKVQPSHDFSK